MLLDRLTDILLLVSKWVLLLRWLLVCGLILFHRSERIYAADLVRVLNCMALVWLLTMACKRILLSVRSMCFIFLLRHKTERIDLLESGIWLLLLVCKQVLVHLLPLNALDLSCLDILLL